MMASNARKRAESGYYHILLVGAEQERMFEDDDNTRKFLLTVRDCKRISEFTVLAYCMMPNHVHFLLKEGKEPVEQIVKRILARFVHWYNTKHRRVGSLFRGRFKSEPVEDESDLLPMMRFIHQSPIWAGLCSRLEDYQFSSWSEYTCMPWLTDVAFTDALIGRDVLNTFHKSYGMERYLDVSDPSKSRVSDEQAITIMKTITRCSSAAAFQRLSPGNRSKAIRRLREQNLSLRQISRLTGTGITAVRRIAKEAQDSLLPATRI